MWISRKKLDEVQNHAFDAGVAYASRQCEVASVKRAAREIEHRKLEEFERLVMDRADDWAVVWEKALEQKGSSPRMDVSVQSAFGVAADRLRGFHREAGLSDEG